MTLLKVALRQVRMSWPWSCQSSWFSSSSAWKDLNESLNPHSKIVLSCYLMVEAVPKVLIAYLHWPQCTRTEDPAEDSCHQDRTALDVNQVCLRIISCDMDFFLAHVKSQCEIIGSHGHGLMATGVFVPGTEFRLHQRHLRPEVLPQVKHLEGQVLVMGKLQSGNDRSDLDGRPLMNCW